MLLSFLREREKIHVVRKLCIVIYITHFKASNGEALSWVSAECTFVVCLIPRVFIKF